ncbi:MAG: type III pantothenate kinase [Candidatus Thiodiazotropha sp.]|jgi:type III pantothenate kinase
MKLYVDIGNSAIKWAFDVELRAGRLHQMESGKLPDAVEDAWLQLERPEAVYIASVRQQDIDIKLLTWIQQQWQLTAKFAHTRRREHGVTNGYQQPQQLGVDRWLALIAAHALSPLPKIIVDCGSATTIDAMDGEGQHIGGIILPGLRLFADCLRRNTDIPYYDAGEYQDYFATDTASGILTGAVVAQCASVKKLYQVLQEREKKDDILCFVTGGDAGILTHHLELPHQVVPGLVLDGLRIQSTQT